MVILIIHTTFCVRMYGKCTLIEKVNPVKLPLAYIACMFLPLVNVFGQLILLLALVFTCKVLPWSELLHITNV